MRPPALALLALVAVACFPRASISDAERQQAARELDGQLRFAQVAVYIGPLYGDETKLLVSDQPVDELDLLEDPAGKTIPAPTPDRVLPPGTPLRIRTVEFPTGWTIAARVVMTPRYHPWIYLDIPGESRPGIVVLPQTVATVEDVRTELDRIAGTADLGGAFRALPDTQRAAISLKRPVEGMGVQALEMAWGYPEKKVVDRPAGTEEWSWPGGRRTASLRDGKLLRWQVSGAPR